MKTDSSVALFHGSMIDCRSLIFSCEFYGFTRENAISFAIDFANWLTSFIGDDFVMQWRVGNRRFSQNSLAKILADAFFVGENPSFGMEGFVQSKIVYNLSTFRKLRRAQTHPLITGPCVWSSYDFPSYWGALFPNGRTANDEIKRNIIKLFRENGRTFYTYNCMPDITAVFEMHPYSNNESQWHGSFRFSVSSHCLGSNLETVAQALAERSVFFSERYRNLNARIMLQPCWAGFQSPYMRYFGQHAATDGSHESVGQLPKEWYPFYYLCGVEWANILSPLVQTHLNENWVECINDQKVAIKILDGGSVLLKSTKAIQNFDIDDALHIRKLVNSALYPGGSSLPLRTLFADGPLWHCPRCDWAIIPVLDDEIDIIGTELAFSSINMYR